jgi:diaminopimelate decarboxylase
MKIYISGLYSGANPQPGVGVVRSLRAAYPKAALVGVGYSNRSSGIHWPDLDELWLQRPWGELDLTEYAARIRELLDAGAFWLSNIDLEIMWLASALPAGHPRLLTPPASALRRIVKPAVEASAGLPLRVPTYVSTERSDWELHAFCRRHDWKVWLKGPYYEAVRTPTWEAVEVLRAALAGAWSTERLFLQTHVTGYEESVCFCAYQGELLDCVYMRKRELTEEGKTWAGDVTEVPEEFAAPLRRVVRELNWTGGAELEMVRDAAGQLWLLECNPRFPAWIHGATITGRNLPARLVAAASGVAPQPSEPQGEEFTRVVLELPVRPQFPLPPLPEPFPGGVGHSLKHPSGTLALAERLHKLNLIGDDGDGRATTTKTLTSVPSVPASYLDDLRGFDLDEMETPAWLFLETTARSVFGRAGDLAANLSSPATLITNGYSIKTNPDERLVRLAREQGFLAEAISLLEVRKALRCGFSTEQVILNGPGKWWPEGLLPEGRLRAVFCDSLADLRRTVAALHDGRLKSAVVGVRLRTPHAPSRFGVPVDTPDALAALVEAVETLPRACAFGVHFHMASSSVGVEHWWRLYESMLRWAALVASHAGREVELLDVGGGWFPDDWHADSADRFAAAVARAREVLPRLGEIVSEPGKAVAQPSMALATRLLEFDEEAEEVEEAVVDGSIAELPMHFFQPHRILHRDARTGAWRPLRRGRTRLMGRLCMEHDVLARHVELPAGARPGDLLVFCDAGAYDRSMSYVFGRG